MSVWGRFSDGVEVDERIFRVLAKYAPDGALDVFASDQHNSLLKMIESFFAQIKLDRKAADADVGEVCRRFAARIHPSTLSLRAKGGAHSAALFNHVVYEDPGFRATLGDGIMLIGRLEHTNTIPVDGSKGQVAQLAREPEKIADKVDAFKTLVKLDPDHKESWQRNLEWLQDVFERCCRLGKPLFNETLIFQRATESKLEMAGRLPDAVVRMAEDFSPFGHVYKTQVPVLWTEDKVNGKNVVQRVSSPDTIRRATQEMYKVAKRPMLLLSAAVDFEQYAAQYGIVCDLIAGPMCGRAYFKEAFKDKRYDGYYGKTGTIPWELLAENFSAIALPRMAQIRGLARKVSLPWYHRFTWLSPEAKALIKQTVPAAGQ